MLRQTVFIGALVALGACNNASHSTFTGPSGQAIHSAKCMGKPDGCYQEASKVCAGSYQVLDSDSRAGNLVDDSAPAPSPITWFNMTFSCGKSDGKIPSFPLKGLAPPANNGPTFTNCNVNRNNLNCTQF